MYTKEDFFKPRRPYNGPHNPQAYQRAIARNRVRNAAMAQANRAEAARNEWLTSSAYPNRLCAISTKVASGLSCDNYGLPWGDK